MTTNDARSAYWKKRPPETNASRFQAYLYGWDCAEEFSGLTDRERRLVDAALAAKTELSCVIRLFGHLSPDNVREFTDAWDALRQALAAYDTDQELPDAD